MQDIKIQPTPVYIACPMDMPIVAPIVLKRDQLDITKSNNVLPDKPKRGRAGCHVLDRHSCLQANERSLWASS